MKTSIHFLIISRSVRIGMMCVSDKILNEIKSHFLFSNVFPENLVVYDIMWKNIVQLYRPHDSMIRRMRVACWVPKATKNMLCTYMKLTCLRT